MTYVTCRLISTGISHSRQSCTILQPIVNDNEVIFRLRLSCRIWQISRKYSDIATSQMPTQKLHRCICYYLLTVNTNGGCATCHLRSDFISPYTFYHGHNYCWTFATYNISIGGYWVGIVNIRHLISGQKSTSVRH